MFFNEVVNDQDFAKLTGETKQRGTGQRQIRYIAVEENLLIFLLSSSNFDSEYSYSSISSDSIYNFKYIYIYILKLPNLCV